MRSPGIVLPSTCDLLCSLDFRIEKIVLRAGAIDPKTDPRETDNRRVFTRVDLMNTEKPFIFTLAEVL